MLMCGKSLNECVYKIYVTSSLMNLTQNLSSSINNGGSGKGGGLRQNPHCLYYYRFKGLVAAISTCGQLKPSSFCFIPPFWKSRFSKMTNPVELVSEHSRDEAPSGTLWKTQEMAFWRLRWCASGFKIAAGSSRHFDLTCRRLFTEEIENVML